MKKGRSENRKMPKPIEGFSLEQIAKACLQGPPKKKWRFMEESKKPSQS